MVMLKVLPTSVLVETEVHAVKSVEL